MNTKTLIRKALSSCLIVAVYATYSMVALAGGGKLTGELSVSGKSASVSVNGQEARSGRTLVSSSTIATPESTTAVIDLGKLGTLELGPNTTASITFNDSGISGNLLSGKVTVLGASDLVKITTAEHGTVALGAGESVGAKSQDDDDDDDDGGAAWLPFALIFGGAAAAIAIGVALADNETNFGGNGTVVSPTR